MQKGKSQVTVQTSKIVLFESTHSYNTTTVASSDKHQNTYKEVNVYGHQHIHKIVEAVKVLHNYI